MCIAYDMRALREPKGHRRGRVGLPFVVEREETNAAVNKRPRVVQVAHQERVGSRTVSLEIPGGVSVQPSLRLEFILSRFSSLPLRHNWLNKT